MKASPSSFTSEVIVAGAGPTGLMLACELKLMGVDVVVIEKRPAGTGESRAPGINARTLEVLDQRGLAKQFRERGKPLPGVLFSGMLMSPSQIDPGWPDALILPQHETEKLLIERATELGVKIHRSVELIHLVQDADGVNLVVLDRDQINNMSARYVVGCDGGHSAVRSACKAKFVGDDPLSHWVVADVQLDTPPDAKSAFGRNLRVGTYQVSRVEPDWYRVSVMKMTPPVDRSAPVTIDELRQAMFDGIGTDYGLRASRWMSRFTDGFRQAERYRIGRVFLAGDAAHTHAPIGGQGLNLGIQDAVNLGWKLAAVISHGSSTALLDTYHEERHSVAKAMMQMTKAQTALIKPGVQMEALRQAVARMIAVPEVAIDLSGQLSGLSLRYSWGEGHHPIVGRRMPNLPLIADGKGKDLFSLLHAGQSLLLNFLQSQKFSLPECWAKQLVCADVQFRAISDDQNWRLPVLGTVPALAAAFVRPDGYVAWVSAVGSPSSTDALLECVASWLG